MTDITGEKRILRTALISLVLIALMLITVMIGMFVLDDRKYYFISLLLILECLFPVFFAFERRIPQAREVALLASLCAWGIVLRVTFYMLPECKPVMALVIVVAISLGSEFGFLTGAVIMLLSDLVFGMGGWTPWQMFAMGLVGGIAGLLFAHSSYIEKERQWRLLVCSYGLIAALLIYGPIMNISSMLMFQPHFNMGMLISYLSAGLPLDLIHAIATFVFLFFLAVPMMEILDHIKIKYGLFGSDDY